MRSKKRIVFALSKKHTSEKISNVCNKTTILRTTRNIASNRVSKQFKPSLGLNLASIYSESYITKLAATHTTGI